jgi:spectinomycin phosphotransferase/16S rRNA (guanine(1405)-N(7))-methyltransferase
LDQGALRETLHANWGIAVAEMSYLPVGWGSHHWEVADSGGARWFVSVDELENKRLTGSESLDAGFARLRASLRAALDLQRAGCEFVVAPVPAGEDGAVSATRDGPWPAGNGEPVVRTGERFALAVYPFVDGESFAWGDASPEWRLGMLGMVAAVHTAPGRARRHALTEEFAVPFRDQLEAACAGDGVAGCGPYARPAGALIREHAAAIGGLLRRYDDLVNFARTGSDRAVLTHGEPHPGNTMLTAGGWRLIDWDTVLVAPPERDLWSLDPGDGSVLDAYTAATGVRPVPELLELYRLGWDVKDIAYDVARFRRPHAESADDVKTWEGLSSLVRRACR